MSAMGDKNRFVFPRWCNYVVPLVLLAIAAAAPYKLMLIGYALNPTTLNVGYAPRQPVPYSHELHVGQLGIDCRYCHTTVEKAAFAAIPPTQTCMNCHFAVRKSSKPGSDAQIARIVAAYEGTGEPMKWKKVHDLPDYAFFNHAIHVNAGVSCVECHGRVDKMDGDQDRVAIVQPLSMGWCLKCHRNTEKVLRPADQVFNLNWGQNLSQAEVKQLLAMNVEGLSVKPGDKLEADQRELIGRKLHKDKQIRSISQMTDCSVCHR